MSHKRPTQAIAEANKERIIELRTTYPEMTLEAIGLILVVIRPVDSVGNSAFTRTWRTMWKF